MDISFSIDLEWLTGKHLSDKKVANPQQILIRTREP